VTVLGVVVAGACGAVLRYLVDHAVQRRSGSDFPLGTLVINVTGSLALGVLAGSAAHHGVSAAWLTVAGTGLIGAYTTFSTFTFDSVRLAEADRWASGPPPWAWPWARPSEPSGTGPLARHGGAPGQFCL
jgi:CrcB protein